MHRAIYIFIFLALSQIIHAQSDKQMDELLERYNSRSVPYISVENLKMNWQDYVILDTRKKEEYDVSHLPGAKWIGEHPDKDVLAKTIKNKNQPVVVYCSVGIRSEDFGERMERWGYTKVQNLYGSIFAWKDAGYDVVNSKNKVTDSVHVFSRHWGKYLHTGTKVYD